MDYIHAETLQVENNNNNDYKQFNSQEAKQARPTLATHTFACKCTHMDAHALTHTYACAHTHARMHARTHTHTHTISAWCRGCISWQSMELTVFFTVIIIILIIVFGYKWSANLHWFFSCCTTLYVSFLFSYSSSGLDIFVHLTTSTSWHMACTRGCHNGKWLSLVHSRITQRLLQ